VLCGGITFGYGRRRFAHTCHLHIPCAARTSAEPPLNLDVGHYRALEWDEAKNMYIARDELGIQVDVDVRVIYPTSQSVAFQPTCLLIMSLFDL